MTCIYGKVCDVAYSVCGPTNGWANYRIEKVDKFISAVPVSENGGM
jgi:hypothetical protein